MTVFVLRSSRSDLVDNCSEKSEKTPRKTPMEVYFINFRWQETLSHGRFLGIFFEWLSAEIHWESYCFINFQKMLQNFWEPLTLFGMGLFEAAQRWSGRGWQKGVLLSKICHTYPTLVKLGVVIPYLKKIQKIHKSRDTPLEFYWHQYFFGENQQFLVYQKMQV